MMDGIINILVRNVITAIEYQSSPHTPPREVKIEILYDTHQWKEGK
jgi:hypothetical protein